MNLSETAWSQATPIYKAILHHPFNKGLMQGNLSEEVFGYYIEQDGIYLKEFGRALALIAGRCQNSTHREAFLTFAQEALIAEQTLVHQFFREKFGFTNTGKVMPATLAYTSYLLRMSCLEPLELCVAALLPCFWIYREVGLYIAQHSAPNNPFERWISTYSGKEFDTSVKKAIQIFDYLALTATDNIRQQMCDVFYTSSLFEWHFWQDAYEGHVFDTITSERSSAEKESSFTPLTVLPRHALHP